MLIDTHAHVNFKAFKDDADEVVKRALEKGVHFIINVGSQFSTSKRALEYANKYDGLFAAVGLHPVHLEEMEITEEGVNFISRAEEFDPAAYRQLATQPKAAAIGETGLDLYHIDEHDEEKISKQERTFIQHIELAKELDLPLIMHCRGSKDDPYGAYMKMLKILSNYKGLRGVIHCFAGNMEIARQFMAQGFHIGFTGIITFDKTGKYEELIRELPLDKILVETDCPYLAPVPYRGKRNEPAYVEFVAEKIADIKRLGFEEVAKRTSENAIELFGLFKL